MELLDGVQACGVDSGHITQTQDDDRLQALGGIGHANQFFGSSEQKRPLHVKKADVMGDTMILHDVILGLLNGLGRQWRHNRGDGNLVDIEERRQGHAHLHGAARRRSRVG